MDNIDLSHSSGWVTVNTTLVAFLVGLYILLFLDTKHRISPYSSTISYGIFSFVGIVSSVVLGPFFSNPDAAIYDRQAYEVAGLLSAGLSINDASLSDGKEGWPIILGLLYSGFGRNTLIGVILNSLFLALIVSYSIRSARLIRDDESFQPKALLWFVASPVFLLYGPTLMREAGFWLGICLMLYYSLKLVYQMSPSSILGYIWASLIALIFRSSLGLVMAVSIFAVMLYIRAEHRPHKYIIRPTIAIGTLFLIANIETILGILGFGEGFLERNRHYLSDSATTGFPVFGGWGLGKYDVLASSMATLPRVMAGPFPWEYRPSLVWVWIFLTTVFWYLVIGKFIKSFRKVQRDYERTRLLFKQIFFSIMITGFALAGSLTNYGITSRMRGAMIVLALPAVMSYGKGYIEQPDASGTDHFKTGKNDSRKQTHSSGNGWSR